MPAQLSLPGIDERPLTHGLYFALRPDAASAGRISRLAERLRDEHGLPGTPVEPRRLHVTLQAFGTCLKLPPRLVAAARTAAERVVFAPFDVVFDRALGFKSGRCYVLTGDEGTAALRAFHRALGEAMRRTGLERWASRRFTPHMTFLYGYRDDIDLPVEPIGWTAREFVLIDSWYRRHRHVLLGRWPLPA